MQHLNLKECPGRFFSSSSDLMSRSRQFVRETPYRFRDIPSHVTYKNACVSLRVIVPGNPCITSTTVMTQSLISREPDDHSANFSIRAVYTECSGTRDFRFPRRLSL